MELGRSDVPCGGFNLEKVCEDLKDGLSLVILLENNMESLKADEIHITVLKQVHRMLKNAQEELKQYIRREQET